MASVTYCCILLSVTITCPYLTRKHPYPCCILIYLYYKRLVDNWGELFSTIFGLQMSIWNRYAVKLKSVLSKWQFTRLRKPNHSWTLLSVTLKCGGTVKKSSYNSFLGNSSCHFTHQNSLALFNQVIYWEQIIFDNNNLELQSLCEDVAYILSQNKRWQDVCTQKHSLHRRE